MRLDGWCANKCLTASSQKKKRKKKKPALICNVADFHGVDITTPWLTQAPCDFTE